MLRLLVLIAAFFTLGTPCARSTLPTTRLRPWRHRYGVRRSDTRFWPTQDRLHARSLKGDPIEAALFDLNRFPPTALE